SRVRCTARRRACGRGTCCTRACRRTATSGHARIRQKHDTRKIVRALATRCAFGLQTDEAWLAIFCSKKFAARACTCFRTTTCRRHGARNESDEYEPERPRVSRHSLDDLHSLKGEKHVAFFHRLPLCNINST